MRFCRRRESSMRRVGGGLCYHARAMAERYHGLGAAGSGRDNQQVHSCQPYILRMRSTQVLLLQSPIAANVFSHALKASTLYYIYLWLVVVPI